MKVNRINVYMSVTLIFSDIIAFASCQDSISLSETLVGRGTSSCKDERSLVITCSTFVNPESSIVDTRSPQTNASTRIRLYLEILSNEILKKGPAQTDRSLSLL